MAKQGALNCALYCAIPTLLKILLKFWEIESAALEGYSVICRVTCKNVWTEWLLRLFSIISMVSVLMVNSWKIAIIIKMSVSC